MKIIYGKEMRIINIYEQVKAVKTGFPQISGPTGIFGEN